MSIKIRQLIAEMSEVESHNLYFYGHTEPIFIVCISPDDKLKEISFSKCKKIDGKDVCRHIHCGIPPEYQTCDIECYRNKYYHYDDYVLPERAMNSLLSRYSVDIQRTIFGILEATHLGGNKMNFNKNTISKDIHSGSRNSFAVYADKDIHSGSRNQFAAYTDNGFFLTNFSHESLDRYKKAIELYQKPSNQIIQREYSF